MRKVLSAINRFVGKLRVGADTDPVATLDVTGDVSISNGLTLTQADNQLNIKRNTSQYLVIENNDTSLNPYITSFSDPANAKNILYHSTTNATNDASTGGALGHSFVVRGTTKLTLGETTLSVSSGVASTFNDYVEIKKGVAGADVEYLTLKPTDTGTNKPYFTIKNTAAEEWALMLWDGTDNNGTIRTVSSLFKTSGELQGDKGVRFGSDCFPQYRVNLEWGADAAGTWRKIAAVALNTVAQYSTAGFIVEILENNSNHAPSSATFNTERFTYYVGCSYTDATVIGTPDACYVYGPASHVRAVKTSAGNYEIQVQNEGQYREYEITIRMYTENVNTACATYFDGSTVGSTGTAQYNASYSGTARDWFQRVHTPLIYGSADNYVLAITGGASAGANLELYGSTHATYPNEAFLDAAQFKLRTADGSADRIVVSSAGVTTLPAGTLMVGDATVSTGSVYLQLGNARTGDGYAYIDFVGDATYTDYGLRIIRNNTGPNTDSLITHRGTGGLYVVTEQNSDVIVKTSNTERLRISGAGATTVTGNATVTGSLTAGSMSLTGNGPAPTIAAAGGISATSFTGLLVPDSQSWGPVIYDGGQFAAISGTATSEVAMTSRDGYHWSAQSTGLAATGNHSILAYGAGYYVTIKSGSTTAAYSRDCKNWTATSVANASWYDCVFGNALFVAVGSSGSTSNVTTSPDGITWTTRTSASSAAMYGVTYNGSNQYVAVGNNAVQYSSSPTTLWTAATNPVSGAVWSSVVWCGPVGLYVAVASTGVGSNDIMTSPDGVTWTARQSGLSAKSWRSVIYATHLGKLIAVAYDGSVVSSTNGTTWSTETSVSSSNCAKMATNGSVLVLTSDAGVERVDLLGNIPSVIPTTPTARFVITKTLTWTCPAGVTRAKFTLVGGGGAGGGSAATIGYQGQGGASGGVAVITLAVTPGTAYTCTVGAAGTGSSNATGGNGGNTSIVVGGYTYTAYGGIGGQPSATSGNARPLGGAVAVCDFGLPGTPGGAGIAATAMTGPVFGGNTPLGFGMGGMARRAAAAGEAGSGYGAGGAPGWSGTAAAQAGGAGAPGVIIIEY